MDMMQFRVGGVAVPHDEFLKAHAKPIQQDAWIIDGYGSVKLAWERFSAADTLVYVDLPFFVHFLWITKRLMKGLFVTPPGWPEGSPVISSSLAATGCFGYATATSRRNTGRSFPRLRPPSACTICAPRGR